MKPRDVSPAAAAVFTSLLLVACGGDLGTEDEAMAGVDAADKGSTAAIIAEEEISEAAAANDLPPVVLPYQTKIGTLGGHLKSRLFIVPHRASLQVIATAWWNRPTACAAGRRFKISLHRPSGLQVWEAKEYPATGTTKGASWQDLEAGTYYLDLRVEPSDPEKKSRCWLIGGVYVTL